MDSLADLPFPEPWTSSAPSSNALMSVRDGAALEGLLTAQARAARSGLNVLEWGSGRSTLRMTEILRRAQLAHFWVALEHDREFFEEAIEPEIRRRSDARFTFAEAIPETDVSVARGAEAGLWVIVFNVGRLRPFRRADRRDRDANLDDYVEFPTRLRRRFDAILIDGRKRRRCLLAAADLLADSGIVVLHDAWRRHYQCAFSAYAYGIFIGDALWVGAQHDAGLEHRLPAHALTLHADADGKYPNALRSSGSDGI